MARDTAILDMSQPAVRELVIQQVKRTRGLAWHLDFWAILDTLIVSFGAPLNLVTYLPLPIARIFAKGPCG